MSASTELLIGRPTDTPTPGIVLFPEPTSVIANWCPAFAERVVPVLAIDAALVDPDLHGTVVVVVWDDPACSFLDCPRTDDGKITLPDEAATLSPLEDPFDRAGQRARRGVSLALQRVTLPLAPPTHTPDWAWQRDFERALKNATGAPFPMHLIRFATYPCYLQDPGYVDDAVTLFCELPDEALGIGAGVFFVRVCQRSVTLELQMT